MIPKLEMSAQTKQYLVWSVASLFLLGVLWIAITATDKPKSQAKRQEIAQEVFAGNRSMKNQGLQGLAVEMEKLQRENRSLLDSIAKIQDEMKRARPDAQRKEQQDLVQDAVNQATMKLRSEFAADLAKKQQSKDQPDKVEDVISQLRGQKPEGFDWSQRQSTPQAFTGNRNSLTGSAIPPPPAAKLKMRTIAEELTPEEKTKKPEKGFFIPAGSILTGVLISGMDAPTGASSKREPFPTLVRIKKEAILPNRYSADVKECFLVASAYGDMSAERAYMRSERLSCIRSDGKVIETKIAAYATGEDGKVGLRGPVVSRSGRLLALAGLSGFASGAAQLFGSNPVPTIATTNQSTLPFQRTFSNEALQSGALKGANTAMERIATYYLDMAEQIFPVIEIDAGRRVDFIFTSGTTLKLEGGVS